jgi:hypothetical protein
MYYVPFAKRLRTTLRLLDLDKYPLVSQHSR